VGSLILASIFLPYGYMSVTEWITGIYYLIFFTIAMFTNTFYNTVTLKGDLTPQL
jgi:hypothetical protein